MGDPDAQQEALRLRSAANTSATGTKQKADRLLHEEGRASCEAENSEACCAKRGLADEKSEPLTSKMVEVTVVGCLENDEVKLGERCDEMM
ncbi:hypothetical protein BLNAU_1954 [Blattamonas nauphoetae]|uniref:Uncharacterized protein n=1 Tax=Blattamonas nauphoetae TaxID=2049346 RepID=A0ABQ9YGZ2_9EUKA|nr:hypothetical protein BLNAU_1954 [Blattamonas nauphoetae]